MKATSHAHVAQLRYVQHILYTHDVTNTVIRKWKQICQGVLGKERFRTFLYPPPAPYPHNPNDLAICTEGGRYCWRLDILRQPSAHTIIVGSLTAERVGAPDVNGGAKLLTVVWSKAKENERIVRWRRGLWNRR